jgi:hypothetical protein
MRPLSASEAISPALDRTKDVLTRPFRWQTFLKLAAVAFFAEIGGGFNFPGGGGNTSSTSSSSSNFLASYPLQSATVAAIVIVGLVFFVIGLILFYISSRLQLVLVEMVATRQTMVAPMWRRYSSLTWRWIGLKLLYFLGVFLLTLVLVGPIVFFYARSGFHPSIVQILLMVAGGLCLLVVLVGIYILLRDFALPFFALEDLSISDALSRLRFILAVDSGQVALYLLLRVILGIVFAIGFEIAAVLILLVSLIPFAIVGGVLWFALHSAGAGGMAILIGCAVIGGLVFLAWMVCVGIALFGPLFMYFQAYALYFLGGRYPLLGDLLDRSTPPPTFAYAAGYPPPPTFEPPQSEPPPSPPLPETPPTS